MTQNTWPYQKDELQTLRRSLQESTINLNEGQKFGENASSILENKTFLITGGASGIGEALAVKLAGAAKNTKTIIADRDRARGEAVQEHLRAKGSAAIFIEVDVSSWDSQVALFRRALSWLQERDNHHQEKKQHAIDHVICCAGVSSDTLDLGPASSSVLFEGEMSAPPSLPNLHITLAGSIYTVQLALKYGMGLDSVQAGEDKSVILMGSASGYTPMPGRADYSCAKYGVRGLFKTLAAPGSGMPTAVRINHFAPAFVRTPLVARRVETLEKMGVRIASLEQAQQVLFQLVCDAFIDAKSIGLNGNGSFDWRDDIDGGFGANSLMHEIEQGDILPFSAKLRR